MSVKSDKAGYTVPPEYAGKPYEPWKPASHLDVSAEFPAGCGKKPRFVDKKNYRQAILEGKQVFHGKRQFPSPSAGIDGPAPLTNTIETPNCILMEQSEALYNGRKHYYNQLTRRQLKAPASALSEVAKGVSGKREGGVQVYSPAENEMGEGES